MQLKLIMHAAFALAQSRYPEFGRHQVNIKTQLAFNFLLVLISSGEIQLYKTL